MMAGASPRKPGGAAGRAGLGGAGETALSVDEHDAAPPPRRRARDNVRSIVGAVLLFLFIRAFLVEAYRIPSGSMVPTLLVGDWLFVNKLVYGPHVPVVDVNLPGYADPKRSDIVVFESPPQYDQPSDLTPTLVKRLWGMPGDTLYMRDGVLYINGVAYPQGPAFADNAKPPDFVDPAFEWELRYAPASSRFGPPPPHPSHDNWGPIVVPPQHYFMMGDNRYDSKDSRYWGLVPRTNLRGRPLFVYYSYDTESGLPYFRALTEIRWHRLGHWIR